MGITKVTVTLALIFLFSYSVVSQPNQRLTLIDFCSPRLDMLMNIFFKYFEVLYFLLLHITTELLNFFSTLRINIPSASLIPLFQKLPIVSNVQMETDFVL